MRLLLATLFLVQLLFSLAHVVPSNNQVLNCDDEEAHQAAAVAVQYINAHHHSGYKFTLNQVEKIIPLPSHGADEIYFFELDLLETLCSHVSSTPIEQCAVRPKIEQAVEADCDFKMRKHNNTFEVLRGKCKSEIKSTEKLRRMCPGCPLLAPFNDSRVVHAVDVALHKFNSGNNTSYYNLHEIGRGRVQHYASCSGTVVKLPGVADEDVTVKCVIHEPQPRKDAQAPQPAPVAPVVPGFIPSRFHHNLHFNNLGIHSSESNSAEHHLLAAHAQRAVKRSLTGEPVQTSVGRPPLCPGRKIHF
ncbi:PREDICTED: alpha-2-HS-glycoprotein [Nanorana parkeri]|uniref:alpha-2-HS-glycoprotein n=1 Tax=Nanorana parkeri TaxID=125878 RepID=UPI000854AD50|nr:PREDICTED: alpha-2-HS-glycoprotein [Nanorana parkeri]